MRRGVKVRELMQREGLSGEVVTLFYSGRTGIIHGDDGYDVIWHVYRNQEKGMIRGDDGEQVSFRRSALHGVDFRSLSSGQRVSYRIQEGWLGKEAVEVRPLPMERIAGAG